MAVLYQIRNKVRAPLIYVLHLGPRGIGALLQRDQAVIDACCREANDDHDANNERRDHKKNFSSTHEIVKVTHAFQPRNLQWFEDVARSPRAEWTAGHRFGDAQRNVFPGFQVAANATSRRLRVAPGSRVTPYECSHYCYSRPQR